jgi:type II secretory pathway pseudopilin PulG
MLIPRLYRRQRGITLIEILVSLTIMAAATAGVVRLIDQYTGDMKASITAQHLSVIGTAAQAYVKDNYGAVVAVATPAVPAVITVATLISTGYLTTGYSPTNNFGQTVCVLVLEPTANNLIALVSSEGGTAIDDITLGGIAGTLGASGGGVYTSATTTLRGAMGGWSSPATDFTKDCSGAAVAQSAPVGHPVMALWFSNGDIASGYLHRDVVAGHPELNTMNTPIIMSATTIQTLGGACTTNGAIGRDATGAVLSCSSGTWKAGGSAYWKDPVADYASLPVASNNIGDVRLTIDTGRAFSWTGATWHALALDELGRLNTTGSTSTYGQLTVQGNGNNAWQGINFKDAAGTNSGTLMMSPTYSGFYNAADGAWRWNVTDTGDSLQAGNAAAGTLQVNTAVAEGAVCTPDGKIAKSSTTSGLILSCQSGVWKKAQGSGGAGSLCGYYVAPAYGGVNILCEGVSPASSCPAGYSRVTGGYVLGAGLRWYPFYYCVKT